MPALLTKPADEADRPGDRFGTVDDFPAYGDRAFAERVWLDRRPVRADGLRRALAVALPLGAALFGALYFAAQMLRAAL